MAIKALITHAKLLEALDYDPETGIFTWKYRSDRNNQWNAHYSGKIAGSLHCEGYWTIRINKKPYLSHRLAIFYMTGEWPKNDVDHKEGNRCDNRFSEIREATRSQNLMNIPTPITNTSGTKGVFFHKRAQKWCAQIKKDSRNIYIGLFKTIEEAAIARREAAERLHCEFARHD
jgi:HNH endonuclease/AP2 domain